MVTLVTITTVSLSLAGLSDSVLALSSVVCPLCLSSSSLVLVISELQSTNHPLKNLSSKNFSLISASKQWWKRSQSENSLVYLI